MINIKDIDSKDKLIQYCKEFVDNPSPRTIQQMRELTDICKKYGVNPRILYTHNDDFRRKAGGEKKREG